LLICPIEFVEEIGAVETPYAVDVELGDGRKLKPTYMLRL